MKKILKNISSITWMYFVPVMLAIIFVGAGCGKSKDITDTIRAKIDRLQPLPGYMISNASAGRRMSDGECLVYLDGDNTIMSNAWQKEIDTARIEEQTYNLTRYRENDHVVRMDAHLLGTDIRLSLDNPAGFVRCVKDFETYLEILAR